MGSSDSSPGPSPEKERESITKYACKCAQYTGCRCGAREIGSDES